MSLSRVAISFRAARCFALRRKFRQRFRPNGPVPAGILLAWGMRPCGGPDVGGASRAGTRCVGTPGSATAERRVRDAIGPRISTATGAPTPCRSCGRSRWSSVVWSCCWSCWPSLTWSHPTGQRLPLRPRLLRPRPYGRRQSLLRRRATRFSRADRMAGTSPVIVASQEMRAAANPAWREPQWVNGLCGAVVVRSDAHTTTLRIRSRYRLKSVSGRGECGVVVDALSCCWVVRVRSTSSAVRCSSVSDARRRCSCRAASNCRSNRAFSIISFSWSSVSHRTGSALRSAIV